MREHKFRAWDQEEKKMHYSDAKWDYGMWFSLDNGKVECLQNCAYTDTFGDEHDDWQPLDNLMAYVCQDKNQKEIYEGDIVKCYADTDDNGNDLYFFYKVVWHEVYHCWWLSDINTNEDEYFHEYNPKDIEVIGNAFENPELLNK